VKGWRGPTYEGEFPTLGYEVLDWLTANLPSPSDDTKPLQLTDEQARIVLHWYRLDPQSGRLLHRRGALEMAKGWGKSPLVAALALADFAGPALFDGWDAKGEPVARPWGTGDDPAPWVQVAANSEDQSENTYGAIYAYLTARDGKVGEALGIDFGRTRLFLKNVPGSRLEPVTASAGSREGQRVTFAVLDETHLWTRRSRGAQLANTLRRNVAKMSGRTLETTNAPILGEQSVAEQTGRAAEAGEPGVWFHATRPSIEPQEDWDDDEMLRELDRVYGDSWWVDRHRLLKEVRDSATDWVDALRFYFNTRTTGHGRAVDPRRWDELAGPPPDMGTVIGLGFDGAFRRDSTCLVGCTREGRSFVLGWWENPGDRDWVVPRAEVHAAVDAAFGRYRVGLMLADPPYWHSEVEEWAAKYRTTTYTGKTIERVVPFDTNQPRRMAPAVNRWLTAISEGNHTHDGDARLAAHVKAAQLRKVILTAPDDDGRTKYVLEKGEDRRRIDGAVADVLALEAAQTMEPPEEPAKVEFIQL
jgi:hypothetical protein